MAPNQKIRPGRKGPRSVGSFLPKITGKVLAKKGFPNMSLITDWPAIVGPELAEFTCPEKMNWPRPPREEPQDAEALNARPAPPQRQRGITLKLRVESHGVLEVQYSLEAIIMRINSYFGYRAVTELRIIQGPVKRAEPARQKPSDHIKCQSKKPLADLSKIEDDDLRNAFLRLDAARRS
ncbi:MAG: DciA family protein [Hyphomicrobiaceae bacterium]|nr:DciA family protein [Hyphomicrobiaceae bacterium]